jgi:hypothetical protein
MFGKARMHFGSFCRGIAGEVIASTTHEVDFDSSGHFTQAEKEALHDAFHHFKLLCILIKIIEKGMAGKIKKSNEEIGRVFMEALGLAYADNHDNGIEKVAEFEELFQGFVKYNESIPEHELAKEGLGYYACVYMAEKYAANRDHETGNARFKIISEIAFYWFNTLDKFFEETFKKVKLIDESCLLS